MRGWISVGLNDEDFNKFQVGIVSAGNEVTPCNLTGPELSEHAKIGVNGPDSAGLIFSTIAVSDGISMGHEGMSEKTKLTINFMKRKMKEYDELKKELENK